MEESSPGFKSSDSFPALLNRFRQRLLISISTNKFPFYSLFSSLAGQWSSVRNSPQDFGRFSQIMSRSPRCDISTEISHSGYKVHDRAHCDKYSGKSSWSRDRDSGAAALMQGPRWKSLWQGRQIQMAGKTNPVWTPGLARNPGRSCCRQGAWKFSVQLLVMSFHNKKDYNYIGGSNGQYLLFRIYVR